MDYTQNKNTSYSANIRSHIVAFISTIIGYSLFSTIKGSESLHNFTLDYINLFLNKINYLELGYALSISFIIISYFIITQIIYCFFNLTQYKSKNTNLRFLTEYLLNITTSVGISAFAIAIFSPYLEFTRDTYNFYHVMLGVNVLFIVIIALASIVAIHAIINTVGVKLPSFKKNAKVESNYEMEEYNEDAYNTDLSSEPYSSPEAYTSTEPHLNDKDYQPSYSPNYS